MIRKTRAGFLNGKNHCPNFYCKGLFQCDIVVPGNRACAVESGLLLREKQKKSVSNNNNRWQNLVSGNSPNMTLKHWKAFKGGEGIEFFSRESAGLV